MATDTPPLPDPQASFLGQRNEDLGTEGGTPARPEAMSPAAFFLLALVMLLFAALFIFIGVKMLIKVWNAKNS